MDTTPTTSSSMGGIALFCLLLMLFVWYLRKLARSQATDVDTMNAMYPSLDGYLRPIDASFENPLYDYTIKTAYNCCCGGGLKNSYVDLGNLKAVIRQGARCLDFEIYSVGGRPMVSCSTQVDTNYYVKETFNSIDFADVMTCLRNYAFSSGTCPNSTDPLLLHLRIRSNQQAVYEALADILGGYRDLLLGPEYSYENEGQNLGTVPLKNLQGKCILMVDKAEGQYLQCEALLEYINIVSHSIFLRSISCYDLVNNPDVQELTDFNRQGMTLVTPDRGAIQPPNPSGTLARTYGCQLVAMQFQTPDAYLEEQNAYFDVATYAFVLKPIKLRFVPVVIDDPEPQNPNYSYATRNVSTDYYQFQF